MSKMNQNSIEVYRLCLLEKTLSFFSLEDKNYIFGKLRRTSSNSNFIKAL